MTAITRADFLNKKWESYGTKRLEKMYGCPYWCLYEWSRYEMKWTAIQILKLRKYGPTRTEEETLAHIKRTNAGIKKIGQEYAKTIAPLGRSAS